MERILLYLKAEYVESATHSMDRIDELMGIYARLGAGRLFAAGSSK